MTNNPTPPSQSNADRLRHSIVMHLITSMPGMSMRYKAYAEEAADEIMAKFTTELAAVRDELLKESQEMYTPALRKDAVTTAAINQVFERHGVK